MASSKKTFWEFLSQLFIHSLVSLIEEPCSKGVAYNEYLQTNPAVTIPFTEFCQSFSK